MLAEEAGSQSPVEDEEDEGGNVRRVRARAAFSVADTGGAMRGEESRVLRQQEGSMSDDVKDGSIQYLERKFAPEIEELRRQLAHANGLFEQANTDRARLKQELTAALLERDDAMAVIERVRAAVGK